MSASDDYGAYISGDYTEYQRKYLSQMRESDREIIEIIRHRTTQPTEQGKRQRLIDIGCANGSLLFHMKHQLPHLELTGADVYPSVIENCRADPSLEGIMFRELDLLNLANDQTYDFVVVNAVLFLFDTEQFAKATANIARILNPGGWFVSFDFAVAFEQELTILEKSITHPNGLTLHFRPGSWILETLEKQGFINASIHPFTIAIDLEKPKEPHDIRSYTVKTMSDDRLLFRGILYQPWCHLVTQRPLDF